MPDSTLHNRRVDALPTWHELCAAFCGHLGKDPGDHPVTKWARLLAELHLYRAQKPLSTAETDARRAEIIAAIDQWAIDQAWTPDEAHAAGLGAAVDRMAAAQFHANQLLQTASHISEDRVHAAWFRLASLADTWTDTTAMTTVRSCGWNQKKQ